MTTIRTGRLGLKKNGEKIIPLCRQDARVFIITKRMRDGTATMARFEQDRELVREKKSEFVYILSSTT